MTISSAPHPPTGAGAPAGPSLSPGRGRVCALLLAGVAAFILLSGLSFLGAWHWSFELLSHFRVQFAVAAVLGVLIFAALGRWRAGLALAAVAAAHLVPVLLHMTAADGPAAGRGEGGLSLLYLNMHHRSADHAAFLAHVREHRPGLLVLTEVDPGRRQALFARLAEHYPYRLHTDDTGPFGMSLFSRHELHENAPDTEGGRAWPVLQASVCPADVARCVDLIAVHAPRPGPGRTARRDAVFARVAARARQSENPAVVVGDFNSTPWSPAFRRLLRHGALRDGSGYAALKPTWISRLPPFGLKIDHVLTGRGAEETRRRIGPAFGSDHFSVQVNLRARRGLAAERPAP
ncbi:MAG: endonuclease/exonuclease/phosphatase family protein [Alphaproteobacteria bacterium]